MRAGIGNGPGKLTITGQQIIMKTGLFSKFTPLLSFVLLASLAAARAQSTNSGWLDQAAQDAAWDSRSCSNDARGQWFRDAKFGAFIHFGLFSELGGYYHDKGPYDPAEQIMGLGERHQVIPWKQYESEV